LEPRTAYDLWHDESGFQKKWIRPEYKFASVEDAQELSRFFFGDELADEVRANNWAAVPECTGVWWLKI
jgi:hypothetical protein